MSMRVSTDASSATPSGATEGSERTRTAPGRVERRAYFRCPPLAATLSLEQCRANRARLSPRVVLELPYEVPSWWVQPLPCWSCSLAPRVEAGGVPFFTADEVLAGRATTADAGSLSPQGAPRSRTHTVLPDSVQLH